MGTKFKNNFTTPEQSKRLLELGVPADSADCYFGSYPGHPDWAVIRQSEFDTEDDGLFRINEDIIPCWSVGRLMEIFDICFPESDTACWPPCYELDTDYITYVVHLYERGIMELDFSKLED